MNFLKRIFSPGLLIFSFLLLIYIFFKSEIYYEGKTSGHYLVYYLISSILIFFSIITFFINQKIKEYLIISCISLLVGLYLFEASFFFKKQNSKVQILKEQIFEKKNEKKWDKRDRFEIYKDLRKTNKKIVVNTYPIRYLNKNLPILALSGTSNSQTIYCNENGYYSIYQSDRYGFNNPDEEWDKKKIEYLLVGDSFVLGACVNRPNDISSILRNLSNKSVLNLGQGGNGPLIEYASLREYMSTNVKKVLWFYYEGNDMKEFLIEKKNNILNNYLNDSNFTQNLKLKQKQIDVLTINYIREEIKEKSPEIQEKKVNFTLKLINFIKIDNTKNLIMYRLSSKVKLPELELSLMSEFKNTLQLSKKLVEKNNAKLYFVYLPEFSRYKNEYDMTNYNSVKKIVNELKIPFIDIHEEVFNKKQNPLIFFPFELDGHYNAEGYRKVAKTVYQFSKD